MIQCNSFLITNEGVFSKWIGVGGIGGNWSIIWRIHIFTVHLLPFCLETHVGLFWRRRKNKSLITSHSMSWHFSCVHLNPKASKDREWFKKKKSKLQKSHYEVDFTDFINVSILINSHLTHILFRYFLHWIWNNCTAIHHKVKQITAILSPLCFSLHTISSVFHFPLDPANVCDPLFYPSLHPIPLIISRVQRDGCEPLLNSRPPHITPARLTVNEKHWMYFIHTPPHKGKGDRKTCRINVCVINSVYKINK